MLLGVLSLSPPTVVECRWAMVVLSDFQVPSADCTHLPWGLLRGQGVALSICVSCNKRAGDAAKDTNRVTY
eukprot:2501395-Prymnesium_polylepis.1